MDDLVVSHSRNASCCLRTFVTALYQSIALSLITHGTIIRSHAVDP